MGAVQVAVQRRGILAHPARVPIDLAGRFTIAVCVILLNVADLVTTRMLLDAGGRETNPVALHLLERGMLEVTKIGAAGFVGVLVLVAPLARRCEQALWAVVVVYTAVLTFHLVQLARLAG